MALISRIISSLSGYTARFNSSSVANSTQKFARDQSFTQSNFQLIDVYEVIQPVIDEKTEEMHDDLFWDDENEEISPNVINFFA